MKSSDEMKKEHEENTGNVNDDKLSEEVKKEPDENAIQQQVSLTKAEKESKRSISRWDTDGGTDLCQ